MPTAPTAIPVLPTPPSRTDPTNFRARADARLAAEPAHTNAMNALGTNVYNNAVEAAARLAQSCRPAIPAQRGRGLWPCVVRSGSGRCCRCIGGFSPGRPFHDGYKRYKPRVGHWVQSLGRQVIRRRTECDSGQPVKPPVNALIGTVSAYSGTSLTVAVTSAVGASVGNISDWDISYFGSLPVFDSARPGQYLRTDGLRAVSPTRQPERKISRATNLLLRSEDYGNAVWVNAGATLGSYTLSPDGRFSARVLSTTNPALSGRIYQEIAITPGASPVYTASVYLKAGIATSCAISIDSEVGADAPRYGSVAVDLTAGTITAVNNNVLGFVRGIVRASPVRVVARVHDICAALYALAATSRSIWWIRLYIRAFSPDFWSADQCRGYGGALYRYRRGYSFGPWRPEIQPHPSEDLGHGTW